MTQPNPIATLNDQFRKSGPSPAVPGRMFTTRGIAALPPALQLTAIARVHSFNAFTPDNDPYGEHDFGSIEVDGVGKIFWKIDYYADAKMHFGSDDPADPAYSFRVLTVMLASEY